MRGVGVLIVAGLCCCIEGKGAPLTLIVESTNVSSRYVSLHVGGYPGSKQTFQVFFAYDGGNVVPVEAVSKSRTEVFLNTTTLRDVVYFPGQSALTQPWFSLTTAEMGTLALGNGVLSYCYQHDYESLYLTLGETCHLSARHSYTMVEASRSDVNFLNENMFSCGPCEREYHLEDDTVNIEYDAHHQRYRFFFVTDTFEETSSLVLVAILTVFLSTWLYWTTPVHTLVENAFMHTLHSKNMTSLSGKSYLVYQADLEDALELNATKKRHIVNEYLVKIAADNQTVWGVVDTYAILVCDLVVLIGSSTFIASMNKHPNLYRQEAIDLTSTAFVQRYVYFWGYFFSVMWPVVVVLCLIYGTVTSTSWHRHVISSTALPFTFGNKRLARMQMVSRLFLFFVIVLMIEGGMVSLWVWVAEDNAYIFLLVCVTPIVMVLGANYEYIQRMISPYFAKLYRYNTPALLLLRWSVEVQLLVGIHALLPLTLNKKSLARYENAAGFFLGVAMSISSGRDLTWIAHLMAHLEARRWVCISAGVALAIFAVFVLVHTSVFLLANIYLSSDSLSQHPDTVLWCSSAFAVQTFCAGSIWASKRVGEFYTQRVKQQ